MYYTWTKKSLARLIKTPKEVNDNKKTILSPMLFALLIS